MLRFRVGRAHSIKGSSAPVSVEGRSNFTPSYGSYSDINQYYRQDQNRLLTERFLPPEPLTEFQNFIISTTGTNLPIFGADSSDVSRPRLLHWTLPRFRPIMSLVPATNCAFAFGARPTLRQMFA